MDVEDTIVAVSSPPGSAVRGIIRLSGPESVAIAERFFTADSQMLLMDHAAPVFVEGHLRVGTADLPAAVYLFRGPKSYTSQDVVEIHLLGSPGVLGLVMEDLLSAGARRAEAGEFTARAYLTGAYDLAQVHGIAGMIAARSDLQLQAAERLLHGALSQTACCAREELADLLSLVEGALDFADEPVEFIAVGELGRRLDAVRSSLLATTKAGVRAERWGQLSEVLLAGPTNAGKSSLLNRLSGMDRAICAPIAGTTRDVISAPMRMGEGECLLLDVAGLDELAGDVEVKAQMAAKRAMKNADLLLWVVDLSRADMGEDILAGMPDNVSTIIVANKCDLIAADQWPGIAKRLAALVDCPVCLASAETGIGCERLKRMIEDRLSERTNHASETSIALMAEHRQALQEALEAIGRAIKLAGDCGDELDNADLIAVELRAAAASLGRLVGQDQTEDLLGRIFSRFCIGK